MSYISDKEYEKYKIGAMDGTKENPYINKVDDNYKLALYLGYNLKWNYDYGYSYLYDKNVHTIRPVFKKSHKSFDFSYVDNDECYYSWDFIMIEVLPRLKLDGIYNDKIEKSLINLELIPLFSEIMIGINKKIKNI